ncbi:MAG: alpha/beta hydrolase [Bdellovibrionota bacterium]
MPSLFICLFLAATHLAASPVEKDGLGLPNCSNLKVSLSSINSVEDPERYDRGELTRWFYAPSSRPQAIALAVHGLATKPSLMNEVALLLNRNGVDVLRLGLTGHRGSAEEMAEVSRTLWLKDFFKAYCLARSRADGLGLPLHFVGFSLGALVGQDLLNSAGAQDVRFDSAALFAPAIAVKPTSHLIKLFWPLSDGFVFPGVTKSKYSSRGGCTIAAYKALFESLAHLESSNFEKSNIRTAVLIDPRDELVSPLGIKNLIRRHALTQWRFFPLHASFPHHLVVAPENLEKNEWERTESILRRVFRLKRPVP